jgi:hypothetical protein
MRRDGVMWYAGTQCYFALVFEAGCLSRVVGT